MTRRASARPLTALATAALLTAAPTSCSGSTTIEDRGARAERPTTTVNDVGNDLAARVPPPEAAVEPPAGSTRTTLPRGERSKTGMAVLPQPPRLATTTGVDRSGADPAVLVIGDSLVRNLGDGSGGAGYLATQLRTATGRSTTVVATANVGFAQLADATLSRDAQPPSRRLLTAAEYVAQVRPQLTVLALGTTDAQTLQSNNGMAGGYTMVDLDRSVRAVLDATFASSRCVVVVNVAQDSGWGRMGGWAKATNELLALVGTADPRITVADWNGASAGQDWFLRRDIHQNDAGEAAYERLIVDNAIARLASC